MGEEKKKLFLQTPEFHNQLLFFYIDAVKNELSSTGPQETASEERKKLIKLLDSSSSYAAEKILPRLPESALHERAILLARLGQHDAALTIYAYKMRSFNLAEEYCKKNYDPEKEDSRDVYLSLLRVYLKPEPSSGAPSTPLIEPALELLSKHYTKLDPAKVTLFFSFFFFFLEADNILLHRHSSCSLPHCTSPRSSLSSSRSCRRTASSNTATRS